MASPRLRVRAPLLSAAAFVTLILSTQPARAADQVPVSVTVEAQDAPSLAHTGATIASITLLALVCLGLGFVLLRTSRANRKGLP